MSDALSYALGSIGAISGDTALIIIVLCIFFALAFYFGKGRITSILFSFYPAMILYKSFPFAEKLTVLHGDKLLVLNKLGIFFLFLIPISIIFNRYIFSESDYDRSWNLFQNGGIAIAGLLLVLIFSYSTVSLDPLHNFGSLIDGLFSNETRLFYWNLVPLALLAFL